MSNHAQIDQNDIATWTAYNETTGEIESVYVDPITNAVLVYGVADDGNIPTSLNHALIDANDYATEIGYNEDINVIEALRCGQNGELRVKIVS